MTGRPAGELLDLFRRIKPGPLTIALGQPLVFAFALFLPAGTPFWRRGWLYLMIHFGVRHFDNFWLLRNNRRLLEERLLTGGPPLRRWESIFRGLVLTFVPLWLVLISLDAKRFRWTRVPAWLNPIGLVLLLGGVVLRAIAIRVNPFGSSVIRVQAESGQVVVSTGPYRFVRHPRYAGHLLEWFGTSLMLGSWLGLLCIPILLAPYVWRATNEERTLRDGLPGYSAYQKRVKYRFVPFLW